MIMSVIFTMPGVATLAAVENQEPGGPSLPAHMAVSTAPAAGSCGELTAAISDLNYKIEYIQGNYTRLTREIEELRTADNEQKKIILQQGFNRSDPDRIKKLELQQDLLRTGLANVCEDIGRVKTQAAETTKPRPGQWHQWPYLPAVSLAIALLALIF